MKGMYCGSDCMDCSFSCMKDIFTGEELRQIDENKSQMSYKSGEKILKQGSYVSQIIFVKTGLLKIILEGVNGRSTILELITGNNFIALPVLGDPKIYPFTVEAVTNCELCFIRKETILDIMETNIYLHQYLLNWYSKDYIYLYSKITTLCTRNNHGKLATVLLYLTNGNFDDNVLNLISRKELAELASISIDSANKILMELKNDRIIDIKQEGITILNRELIEKLSTIS